jgi:twitching motility protein PilT
MAPLIDRLLQTCVDNEASDLHLTVGRPPTLRIHGRLRSISTGPLTPEDTTSLMKAITPDRCQQELQESGTSDFAFSFQDKARFRVSVFKQKGLVGIALRLIPWQLKSFEELGLPESIMPLLHRPRGLFLVTGPTGSGKTTTLATMIDYINTHLDAHIITVEDPIEYYQEHKKCIVTQREVGVDVPTFEEGLRRAMRQDPDVMLVGEMRDLATMEAAVTAAETGHLVFATVHTTSAENTCNRIIDAFPQAQQEQIRVQLSVTLLCIIAQVLVPRADTTGRIAAFEIMVSTPAIRNLIRENQTYKINSSIQTGKKLGMILLDEHLFELFTQGKIPEEEMFARCRNREDLVAKLRDYRSRMEMEAKQRMRRAPGPVSSR